MMSTALHDQVSGYLSQCDTRVGDICPSSQIQLINTHKLALRAHPAREKMTVTPLPLPKHTTLECFGHCSAHSTAPRNVENCYNAEELYGISKAIGITTKTLANLSKRDLYGYPC